MILNQISWKVNRKLESRNNSHRSTVQVSHSWALSVTWVFWTSNNWYCADCCRSPDLSIRETVPEAYGNDFGSGIRVVRSRNVQLRPSVPFRCFSVFLSSYFGFPWEAFETFWGKSGARIGGSQRISPPDFRKGRSFLSRGNPTFREIKTKYLDWEFRAWDIPYAVSHICRQVIVIGAGWSCDFCFKLGI